MLKVRLNGKLVGLANSIKHIEVLLYCVLLKSVVSGVVMLGFVDLLYFAVKLIT
jgi:hypothetical protein